MENVSEDVGSVAAWCTKLPRVIPAPHITVLGLVPVALLPVLLPANAAGKLLEMARYLGPAHPRKAPV